MTANYTNLNNDMVVGEKQVSYNNQSRSVNITIQYTTASLADQTQKEQLIDEMIESLWLAPQYQGQVDIKKDPILN